MCRCHDPFRRMSDARSAQAQLQDIVDDVSGLLGAPTVLEDTSFMLIAYSSQGGVQVDPVRAASILGKTATAAVRAWFEEHGIVTATGPVRVPGDPELKIAARFCLPARSAGRTHGYLWVLEPGTGFSSLQLASVESLTRRAGELLAGRRQGEDTRDRLVEELLSGDAELAASARTALAARGELPASGPLSVVVVRTEVPTRSVLTRVIAADDSDDPLGPALRRAARLVGEHGRAGVAGLRSRVAELATARHEADCAAKVARARPHLGTVLSWADLGFYRVVGRGAEAVEALIAGTPAARLRTRADAELIRTALVYLDQAGHAARTAAALSVHRQTLYYRLEKIEQLCGVDLDQGEARLQLHLGLALGEVLPLLH
jgi:PucR-like helix-turn-helix protein